jgi:hypothetical protein
VPVLSRLWSQAWTLSHICVWAGSCRTAHAACAIPSCAELQARKKLRVLCLAGKFSSPHAGPEEPVTRPEALGSVIAHIRVRDLDAVGLHAFRVIPSWSLGARRGLCAGAIRRAVCLLLALAVRVLGGRVA